MTRLIVSTHKDKKIFKASRFSKHAFNLVHYTGEVQYDTQGCLEKNIDPLNNDCRKVMKES